MLTAEAFTNLAEEQPQTALLLLALGTALATDRINS